MDYSGFLKVSPKLDLDYTLSQASVNDVIDYEIKGFTSMDSSIWYHEESDYSGGMSRVYELLTQNRLGHLSEADMNAQIDKYRKYNNHDQIKKYLLQNPIVHQENVSVNIATERSSNTLSAMYQNSRQHYKKYNSNEYMVNFRNRTHLFKWLDFNFNGSYRYSKNDNSGIGLPDMSPYEMLVDEKGDLIRYSNYVDLNYVDRNVPIEKFPYSDWSWNPIEEMNNRELITTNTNARVQAGLTVKFWEGLTFDSRIQYELIDSYTHNYYNENTYTVRNTVNAASSWDKETNEVTANLPTGGFLDQNRSRYDVLTIRNQLNFNHTFAEKHAIAFVAGIETIDRTYQYFGYPRTYGYNDETLSVGNFPNGIGGTGVYQLTNWQGSNQTFGYQNSFSYTTDRYFSAFGNLSYTFDDRYTVSGSVRTDASNLITDDPKYRYAPFWSVGLGWQIGKEDFMQDAKWIDRLNIRATYGYNGNVDRSTSFRPLINVNSTQNLYTHDFSAAIQSFGNPDLRWERTGTWDIGVDYSFLKGKLAGKLDVYSKVGKDLMASMSIPAINGTTSQSLNAAKMTNRGIELEVGTQLPVYEDKIVWTGNLNFSYNKNKIQDLYKATYAASDLYGGGTYAYVEGYDANTLWVFEYAGVENRGTETSSDWQPVVKGENGTTYDFSTWTPGNGLDYMKNAGTKVAPYAFGFSNSFKIYDFNLSFLITGKFGHKFMRTPFNYPSMFTYSAQPNKYYSEVVNSDPSEQVPIPFDKSEPRFYFWDRFYPYLDYLVESAAHIRLQEVNLTYNMPKRLLQKTGIDNLAIYVQGNNLCTWLKNKYKEDPEHPFGTTPLQATYTFGLRFDF